MNVGTERFLEVYYYYFLHDRELYFTQPKMPFLSNIIHTYNLLLSSTNNDDNNNPIIPKQSCWGKNS